MTSNPHTLLIDWIIIFQNNLYNKTHTAVQMIDAMCKIIACIRMTGMH